MSPLIPKLVRIRTAHPETADTLDETIRALGGRLPDEYDNTIPVYAVIVLDHRQKPVSVAGSYDPVEAQDLYDDAHLAPGAGWSAQLWRVAGKVGLSDTALNRFAARWYSVEPHHDGWLLESRVTAKRDRRAA